MNTLFNAAMAAIRRRSWHATHRLKSGPESLIVLADVHLEKYMLKRLLPVVFAAMFSAPTLAATAAAKTPAKAEDKSTRPSGSEAEISRHIRVR